MQRRSSNRNQPNSKHQKYSNHRKKHSEKDSTAVVSPEKHCGNEGAGNLQHFNDTIVLPTQSTKNRTPLADKVGVEVNRRSGGPGPFKNNSKNLENVNHHTRVQRKPRNPPTASRRRIVVDSDDSEPETHEEPAPNSKLPESKHHSSQISHSRHDKQRRDATEPALSRCKPMAPRRSLPSCTTHVPSGEDMTISKNADVVESIQKIVQQVRSMPCTRKKINQVQIPVSNEETGLEIYPLLSVQRPVQKSGKKTHKAMTPHRKYARQSSAFIRLLPGEIRNTIYQYAIPEARIMIFATSPKAEVAAAKKLWVNEDEHIKQPRSRLYCMSDREQLKRGLQISTAMLLVSKQISQEIQYFLYSRTIFCFPSLNMLCRFVSEAPKQGIASVKRIELDTGTYGEPFLMKNRVFKERYDRKWHRVCGMLGSQMTNLAQLKLYSHSVEWPMGKIEQTEWHKALMRIVQSRKLHDVEVHLTNPWLGEQRLARIRSKIERSMITDNGQREREDREHQECFRLIREAEAAETAQRSKVSSIPTVKCLRIILSSAQATANA